jgi:hypothetical protein
MCGMAALAKMELKSMISVAGGSVPAYSAAPLVNTGVVNPVR